MQEIAKKLKIWKEFVAKQNIGQDKQKRIGELSMHRERNLATVSELLPQIWELQN